jgi:hypothetical protein
MLFATFQRFRKTTMHFSHNNKYVPDLIPRTSFVLFMALVFILPVVTVETVKYSIKWHYRNSGGNPEETFNKGKLFASARRAYLARDANGMQLRTLVYHRMNFKAGLFEPWKCPHCGAKGRSAGSLDLHMLVHLSKQDVMNPRSLLGKPGKFYNAVVRKDDLMHFEERLRRQQQHSMTTRAVGAYDVIARLAEEKEEANNTLT